MIKKGTIRRYRNTIQINFTKRGDNFTTDVPHKPQWLGVIAFLRRRGFKVGVNDYFKKQFTSLSSYNKIGFKNDVACLLELGAASIEIQMGHIKNLWTPNSQSFWDIPTDDRYTPLTYLERLSVELEIHKLIKFCSRYGLDLKVEKDDLTPEEYILDTLKTNTHIHGEVNCLEDIKRSMENDKQIYNQKDANDKLIVCGQTKYFYDSKTNRLFGGVVWHHINNMWWVICGSQLHNIACFKLFDYDPFLKGRKILSTEAQTQRLYSELKKEEERQNYERCIVLRALLPKKNLYRIWSISHECWWRGNNNGYTSQKNDAGVYPEDLIQAKSDYYNNGTTTRAVLI